MVPPTADSTDRPTAGRSTTLGLALLAGALGSCAPGDAEPDLSAAHTLLFTVDTLRSDYLGCYGAPPDWTPRIDAFAAESLRFEQAYSQATITNPSLTSMLTGLQPVQHGVHVQSSGYAPGILPAPVMLQGKGISTGSFIANMCKLQDVPGTVYSSGWDEIFCGMLDAEPDVREQYDWDRAVVTGGLERIERQGGSWFCWMHLMDPHAEHRPDPAFWDYAADPVREKFEQYEYYNGFESRREQPGAEVVERLQALYVAQIRGVDERFGEALDTLAQREDAGEIAIVFSADHGEELFETWTRYDHGLSMTEGVFQVPLIVRAPGLTPGVVQAPVELLAVAPTVLDLFDVEPPYTLAAASLVSQKPSKGYAFSYGATITTSVRNANGRYWLRHTAEPYTRGEDEAMAPWRAEAPWFQKKQNFAQYGEDGRTPAWLDVRRGEGARLAERAKVVLQSRHAEALELAANFGEAVQIDDPEVAAMLKSLGYLEDE
ncbi:MAG: sulfatase [Planctomycetota bacterium]|jgi:arylsulfatase A-like enzyme